MCLSPILIKNPYYQLGNRGYNYLHDTLNTHIMVPCGSCPQCASLRQGFYNQRVQMESLRSHLFMFTLTYNNESLNFVDCGQYHYPVHDITDIQNMFKRLRRQGHKIRYSYVCEYGTKKGSHRPHYHGILAIEKSHEHWSIIEKRYRDLFMQEWKRNIAIRWNKKGQIVPDTFNPKWQPLFTPVYKRGRLTTFDFHYIIPSRDHESDVSFYVSKYITKYDSRTAKLLKKIKLDPTLNPEETSDLLRITRPRCVTSKDFGDYNFPAIRDHIMKGINSCIDFPKFFDLYTGKAMLLSRYYRRLIPAMKKFELWKNATDYYEYFSQNYEDDSTILDYKQKMFGDCNKYEKYYKSLRMMEKRYLDDDSVSYPTLDLDFVDLPDLHPDDFVFTDFDV